MSPWLLELGFIVLAIFLAGLALSGLVLILYQMTLRKAIRKSKSPYRGRFERDDP